jgi:hypothetical protein
MDNLLSQLEKADRLDAITQRVGFALWQLQELEGVTAQYFVLVGQSKKGMGLDAGNALLDKAIKNTFGATIRQMSNAGLLSADLQREFGNLLKNRNWLVHKSRSQSRSAIHNEAAMQQVMKRLDAIADEALVLLRKIGALTDDHVKKHGVTEEYIAKKANEILEQWHTADED